MNKKSTAEKQSSVLDPDEVRRAFNHILGREPTDLAVEKLTSHVSDIQGARRVLLRSPEFARKYRTITAPNARPVPLDFDRERLVYLHIPKCGGTTLNDLLVSWYGAENTHAARHNQLYDATAIELASKLLFSGHYDFYSTRLIPGNVRRISFLRDPRDRLISLYHFHRAHDPVFVEKNNLTLARWAGELDIDDYFANPRVRESVAVNNAITRFMSDIPQIAISSSAAKTVTLEEMRDQAIANVERFSFIGFLDRYDASIACLSEILQMPSVQEITRKQVLDNMMDTAPGFRRIERQMPSAQTLAQMEPLIEHDRAVYSHADKVFRPLIEKYLGDAP